VISRITASVTLLPFCGESAQKNEISSGGFKRVDFEGRMEGRNHSNFGENLSKQVAIG